jgi:hypothetical protein
MHDEKVIRVLILASLLAMIGGCVSTMAQSPSPVRAIELHEDTARIEGWFSARGEWMVNTTPEFESYNPAGKPTDQRCVSVVNATGADRRDYAGFDGKWVVVTGFVKGYDDLPIGPSSTDELLMKRYYDKELVLDSCRRRMVFVAESVRLAIAPGSQK